MEVVVVVLAAAVVGLLVLKSVDRDVRAEPPRYDLMLRRRPDGYWAVDPPAPMADALTVTLLVPWEEVGQRYSGLNVVVR